MSMRNYGCTGHITELEKLLALLPTGDPRAQLDVLVSETDSDPERIREVVNNALPDGLPRIESVFQLQDEDEAEELERGVWYAYFAVEDLYESVRRPGLIALQAKGVYPERKNWVVFG